MDKYIYDNSNGLWYDYREIITSPVWYYLPKKKKGISEYGDIGICSILKKTARFCIPICSQAAS